MKNNEQAIKYRHSRLQYKYNMSLCHILYFIYNMPYDYIVCHIYSMPVQYVM